MFCTCSTLQKSNLKREKNRSYKNAKRLRLAMAGGASPSFSYLFLVVFYFTFFFSWIFSLFLPCTKSFLVLLYHLFFASALFFSFFFSQQEAILKAIYVLIEKIALDSEMKLILHDIWYKSRNHKLCLTGPKRWNI